MAITDVYYSPNGAGDEDGSSAANAYPATSSGSWASEITGEDTEGKRFIFLAGTYEVDNSLTFTGTPTKDNPFFWVGADASGNVITTPAWEDEKRLRIDATNIPKFEMTANNMFFTAKKEFMNFTNCSFEVTSGTFNKQGVIDNDAVNHTTWYGIRIKAAANHASGYLLRADRCFINSCSLESTTNKFDSLLRLQSTTGNVINSSFIGASTTSAGGSYDGNGIQFTQYEISCSSNIIWKVPGNGLQFSTSAQDFVCRVKNNTIVDVGNNGIGLATGVDDKGSYLASNLLYGIGNNGVAANASDSDVIIIQDMAIGDVTGVNYNNLDDYDAYADLTTVAAAEADFYDYTNGDFRIKRTSSLYKGTPAGDNYGALQNEDYEFVAVS